LLLVGAIVCALAGVLPGAAIAAPEATPAIGLPAPFAQWNVSVEHGTDPHAQWVSFDSAILHRRVTMRVVLPDAYGGATPLPVVYYLHGTLRIGTDPLVDQAFDALAANGANVGYPFGPGNAHNEASFLITEAARLQFVVVSPDAERSDPFCEHCAWVDGRGGQGVDAESHLLREVLPLTEAMFHVRSDWGGRGIMGASMGAAGALIQALRHPDLFSVVAALSPPVDYIYDLPYADFLWTLYLRQQGYPLPRLDPMPTRSINPADLLGNVRGAGIDTIITVGEGCVPQAGQGECATASATDEPIDAIQELFIRHQDDEWIPPAVAAGYPISYITYPGVHFVVNHAIFNRYLLDRMNEDLTAEPRTPAVSGRFLSGDRAFSLWGWDLSLARPVDEFVEVQVRPDGRAATVTGSGSAQVVTPPAVSAGSQHQVHVERDGARTQRVVVAGPDGRLRFTLDLSPRQAIGGLSALRSLGLGTTPTTRISID
jgi:hypothetical protein